MSPYRPTHWEILPTVRVTYHPSEPNEHLINWTTPKLDFTAAWLCWSCRWRVYL